MATEVLRPQDCLIDRIRVPPAGFSRRKPAGYSNGNPSSSCSNYYSSYYNHDNGSSNPRSSRRGAEQKKASVSRRSASADDLKATPEKVMILRRGESPDSKIKSEALAVCGIQRLGPGPVMIPASIYAGSAFAMSPAPSSLPLPSFSKKKPSPVSVSVSVDDSATRDLRRLLRIG